MDGRIALENYQRSCAIIRMTYRSIPIRYSLLYCGLIGSSSGMNYDRSSYTTHHAVSGWHRIMDRPRSVAKTWYYHVECTEAASAATGWLLSWTNNIRDPCNNNNNRTITLTPRVAVSQTIRRVEADSARVFLSHRRCSGCPKRNSRRPKGDKNKVI